MSYNPPAGSEGQHRASYADRDRPAPNDYYAQQAASASYPATGYGYYDAYAQQPYSSQPGGERWDRSRDATELAAPGHGQGYASDAYSGPNAPRGGRRHGPKPPSDESNHIIFLGIDPEMTEAALLEFLRNDHSASIESTTIIRDKQTGASKGFGFAAFSTVAGASAFLHANYPLVLMPALHPHSEPRRAKIDFSASNGSSSASSWADASSSGPSGARGPAAKINDGMRDIGPNGGGNRVLLIRGLDVLTRGDEVVCRIGEEIDRLVGREQVGSVLGRRAIQRVIMISDERTKVGWGFGFVEFFQPELATNLLAHLQSPVAQPRGFVLHSAPHRPVASSFANPTSFAPIDPGAESTDGCVQASGPGGIGGGAFSGWCSYWDERAEATETLGGAGGGIDEKLDAYLESVAPAAPVASLTEATPAAEALHKTGPISISTKAKKKEMPEIGMIPIVEKRKANVLGDDDEEEDLVGKDFVLPSRTKGVRMIPTMTTSKKIAKNISKWNTKQTELAKIPKPAPVVPKDLSTANSALGSGSKWNATSTPAASSLTPPAPKPASPAAPVNGPADIVDYTDTSTLAFTGKVACLLCQRQFKTEDVLRKHVAQSDLHKTNLADPNVCELGAKRKAAAVAAAADPDSAKKYRDRAAERRTVHHQSAAPVPEAPTTSRRKDGPAAPAKPEPALEPAKDESNVGNQLLAKMGWKAGAGLGLDGDGRVAPVLAQQFENRAGLGASTGREAGKYSGAEGYRTMAKDMAKSRYESSESK